jgi:hypothetical protein
VQISVADVDANGRALSTSTSFALCGQVRSQGESDDSLNRLATKEGREFDLSFLTSCYTDCVVSSPECLVVPKMIEEDICSYLLLYISSASVVTSGIPRDAPARFGFFEVPHVGVNDDYPPEMLRHVYENLYDLCRLILSLP